MKQQKGYGMDQVAHYFLSEPGNGNKENGEEVKGPEHAESMLHRGKSDMLRIACKIEQADIERKKLVDAAGDFLLHYQGNPEVSRIAEMTSPDFGSADLTFLADSKDHVTLVRLSTQKECESFVVNSVAYYLWIRDIFSASGSILGSKVDTELFIFSPRFSTAVCHTVAAQQNMGIAVHLIRYRFFQVEHLAEPVVHFQPVLAPVTSRNPQPAGRPLQPSPDSPQNDAREKDPTVQAGHKYSEFMRLRRHLDD